MLTGCCILHGCSLSFLATAGSYTPQGCSTKYAHHDTGSASFCTTGRNFSASGASSSDRDRSTLGPGEHGAPAVAYTGADLHWASQHKPGAAAAFKTPSRSTTSATQLREQLQRQKYQDGKSVPWLLAPPKHTGGRPLPGPKPRLVQSAHHNSCTVKAMQDQPHRAGLRSALGASSAQRHGTGPQSLEGLASIYCGSKPSHSSSTSGRTTWQLQDSSTVGPGSYNLLQYGALQDRPLRSAFVRPLVQDRFGVSTLRHPQQQQQQPQQDDRQQPKQQQQQQCLRRCSQVHGGAKLGNCFSIPSSRQPGVSVGFRSRSPGHAEALMAAADAGMVGAPGPSYYSPQPPPHKVSYRQARSFKPFVAVV